jgi:hypothetical protein
MHGSLPSPAYGGQIMGHFTVYERDKHFMTSKSVCDFG